MIALLCAFVAVCLIWYRLLRDVEVDIQMPADRYLEGPWA